MIVKGPDDELGVKNGQIVRARALSHASTRGVLMIGGSIFPCRFGRGGAGAAKREGDGRSPVGTFALRRLFFRTDRVPRPVRRPAAIAIHRRLGWCDDPSSPLYNRPVQLPTPWRHEKMWREDGLYDLCIEIGYNDGPVRRGMGSAIFLHLTAQEDRPTEGCIAISRRDMNRLLARLKPGARISIG